MSKPITHQVRKTTLKPLDAQPKAIRWKQLNEMIEQKHPDFQLKTINGCVWKLVQDFPDKVYKPEKGVFKSVKYR